MWIFIWAVLSSFVLGIFIWSLRILFQQKAAWRRFATKMKLTYQPGPRFLSSPVVMGALGSYGFGLYTERQEGVDSRVQRFNTVLEIALRSGLPATGGIGTQTAIPLIQTMRLDQSFVPAEADWDPSWMIRSRHNAMVRAYLTPARMALLKKIFGMKIVSALFIFDEQDSVLRIETADPLHNQDRLEKIVKSLVQQAEGLIVRQDEWAQLSEIVQSRSPSELLPGQAATPAPPAEQPAPPA